LKLRNVLTNGASRIIFASLDNILPAVDRTPEQAEYIRENVARLIVSAVKENDLGNLCDSSYNSIVPTDKVAKLIGEYLEKFKERGSYNIKSELKGIYIQLKLLAKTERTCMW